jgi:uncharacterized membrane protein
MDAHPVAPAAPSTPRFTEPEPPPARERFVNVGEAERTWSTALGIGATAYGLFRRDPLGIVLAGVGTAFLVRGLTGHSESYRQLEVDTALGQTPDPTKLYRKGLHLAEAVTVSRPRVELYDFFQDLTNQSRFMEHVDEVEVRPDGTSTWHCEGPGGIPYTYDAEVINEEPGRLLSWRTVHGTPVQHVGTARFIDAPGGRGTEVRLELQYLPPVGGAVASFGRTLLKLVGQDPARDVRRGLRNFKRLMETGELPTIDGQAKGSC